MKLDQLNLIQDLEKIWPRNFKNYPEFYFKQKYFKSA